MKTNQQVNRAAMLMGAAAAVLALGAAASADEHRGASDNPWPYNKVPRSPVLALVGDIACQPGEEPSGEKKGENCSGDTAQNLLQAQAATARQIEQMQPDLVALLGDEQYQVGGYADFEGSFDLTYGAFKFLHRPSPGNHEFYNEHGAIGVAGYGYFSYYNGFQHNPDGSVMTTTVTNPLNGTSPDPQPVPLPNGQAGHFEEVNGGLDGAGVGDGWYSYDLGSWHLISLNIECETQPGGCSNSGSWFAAELEWLRKDLESNHAACTLAYWHQPTFSAANSIAVPEGPTAVAFWQLLYAHGADLIVNGHDHLYARYRPLDPSGNFDPRRGIREFIVGTGGETLDQVVTADTTSADPSGNRNFNAQNLEAATGQFWGVMGLTLNRNGYAWDFESALKDPAQPGGPASYSDKGSGTCHGAPDR
ncbi:MAG TPA: metallophosphoesterase [Steroidobacteraceae bacterium]|nr:metallophosphoesterase [Steroidobacteraceae bacterium]